MNLNGFTPNAPQANASIPLPIIDTPEGAQGQRRNSLVLPLNITGIIQSPLDMQTNSTASTRGVLNTNNQTSSQRPGGTSSTTLQPSEPPPRRHVTSSAHFSRAIAASYPPPVAPTTSFLANWTPAPSKPPKTQNKQKPHNEGGNNSQKKVKKEANRKAARRTQKEEGRSQKDLKHQDSGPASQAGPSASTGSGLRFSPRQAVGSAPRQGVSGATQAPSSAARPSSSSTSASAISPSTSSSSSPQAPAQTQASAQAPAPASASAQAPAQEPTPAAAPARELGARPKIRSGSSGSPQSSASSLSAQSPQSPQSQSQRLTPHPPNLQDELRAEGHEGRIRRDAGRSETAAKVKHRKQVEIPQGSVICSAKTNGKTGNDEKVRKYNYFQGEFPNQETVPFDEAKAKCDSMTKEGGKDCKTQAEKLCKGLFSRVNTKEKGECDKVKDYEGSNGRNLNDWQKSLDCTNAQEGAGAGAGAGGAGSVQGGAGNATSSTPPAKVKHKKQAKLAPSSLVCGSETNRQEGDARRVTGYRTLALNLPTEQFVTADDAQAAINAIFFDPNQSYCSAQSDLLAEQWTARVDTRNPEECKKLKNFSQGQNSWQSNLNCNPSTTPAPAPAAAAQAVPVAAALQAAPAMAAPAMAAQAESAAAVPSSTPAAAVQSTNTSTSTTMSPSEPTQNWRATLNYALSLVSVAGVIGSVYALWSKLRSSTKAKEGDLEDGNKSKKKVTKASLDEVQPLTQNGKQNAPDPKKRDDKSDGNGSSGTGTGTGGLQQESSV